MSTSMSSDEHGSDSGSSSTGSSSRSTSSSYLTDATPIYELSQDDILDVDDNEKLLLHRGLSSPLLPVTRRRARAASRSIARRTWSTWFRPWIRAFTGATPFLLVCAAIICWSKSSTRQSGIAVLQASCLPIPWYYLYSPKTNQRYFDTDALYIPPDTKRKHSEFSANSHSNELTVAHVQVCSHPYADSVSLATLLESHTAYSRRHGIEYALYGPLGARTTGMWRKIEALQQAIQEQLERVGPTKAHWILYSDTDTLIINPTVPMQDILPPKRYDLPFLIATKDWNGLNGGTFFVRVEERSLDFLMRTLAYPLENPDIALPFAEQSAMGYLIEADQLEQKGEVVFLPRDWINSYDANRAIQHSHDTIQLHFPRKDRKASSLLPLLDLAAEGQLDFDEPEVMAAGTKLAHSAQVFWHDEIRRSKLQ